jgi:quercetin dioxygenase-like cupin family protein
VAQPLKSLLLGEIGEPVSREQPDRGGKPWEIARSQDHLRRRESSKHAGQSGALRLPVTAITRFISRIPNAWAVGSPFRRPSPFTSHDNQDDMSGRSNITHVPKPWGHETIWAKTDQYVGKILHIKAGEALSVQYHNVKDETVYLLTGELIYRIWENDQPKNVALQIGDAFHVTPGTIHQMEAVTDCDILEVSTPHLDDVVRLTDRYGREGTSAP